jgi:hypothetical protein
MAAGGGDDSCAPGQEALDGGAPQAFGAAADEDPLAGELFEIDSDAHSVISSALMASFSSMKS